jgi:hypothetical protein
VDYQGTPLSTVGDQVVGVITDDAIESTVDDDGGAMRGTFSVEPGNCRNIALVASDREPLFIPDPAAVDERLDRTIGYWCRWSHGLIHVGPWASVVERSALVLKLLLAEDTGAAAATTSLPERVGGRKSGGLAALRAHRAVNGPRPVAICDRRHDVLLRQHLSCPSRGDAHGG